jgi:hypothetical protein
MFTYGQLKLSDLLPLCVLVEIAWINALNNSTFSVWRFLNQVSEDHNIASQVKIISSFFCKWSLHTDDAQ